MKSNRHIRFKTAIAFFFGFSLISFCVLARADDVQRNNGDQPVRYHYRDGLWYGQDENVVPGISIGAVVVSLPPQNSIVIVGTKPYFYDNTRYYRRAPDGTYIVVASPR